MNAQTVVREKTERRREECATAEHKVLHLRREFHVPKSSGYHATNSISATSTIRRAARHRTDFAGILKDEYIPDWAKQAIRDAQEVEQETEQEESQEQNSGMQMQ